MGSKTCLILAFSVSWGCDPALGEEDATDNPSTAMLKEISFFSDMPDSDLKQIASITAVRRYGKADVIIEERTEAQRFCIVHQGKIEISKKFEEMEEFVLSVQSDGAFFGEMALLDEGTRSATVRALEPTTVLEISRNDFETLLYKAPVLAYRIMKELSSRLRETGALLISYLKQRNKQLYRSYIDTMTRIVQAVDRRNMPGMDRTHRVAGLAREIGREMRLVEEDQLTLELAALMHDLGMISVPEKILDKPGPLSQSEFEKIRTHTKKSIELIQGVPMLEKVVPQILSHHERFDGSGYPAGLKGEDIPLVSRILAVADAWEAMTKDRPWRERMSTAQADEELKKGAGTQFDPTVVEAFSHARASGRLDGIG